MKTVFSLIAIILLSFAPVSAQGIQENPVENKTRPELMHEKVRQIQQQNVQKTIVPSNQQLSISKTEEIIDAEYTPTSTLSTPDNNPNQSNRSSGSSKMRSGESLSKATPKSEITTSLGARAGKTADLCTAKKKACSGHNNNSTKACCSKKGNSAKGCCAHGRKK